MYLQGAHVTAYAPRGGGPVLFLSRASRFARGAPIRGGIPLVFPWFGRKTGAPDAPLHGPARLLAWSLEAATIDAAGVVAFTFGLADVAAAGWPAGVALRYRVEIGAELRLALEVENRGRAPLAVEEALHTYLAVDDVARISVIGLEGAAFLDETEAFARKIGPPRAAGRDGPHLRRPGRLLRRMGSPRAAPRGDRQDGLRLDRGVESGRGARADAARSR
jgi:D-hexose-6-phosphate mutarotase